MSAAKHRFPPEADNPDIENLALHRLGEVQCLHFLNGLSGITQFGFKKTESIIYGEPMRKLTMDELNRLSAEEYKISAKPEVCVILDNVRSQNNIGSVFRTCDAFRVLKLCLCGITSTPPHREIHKTALGAEDSVDWEYYKETRDAVKNLQPQGYKVYAAEQTDKKILLQDFQVGETEKIAIVFGHEVKGVDQEVIDICDGVIEIPQFGTKHSLNIAVSAGIIIWEIMKKKNILKYQS